MKRILFLFIALLILDTTSYAQGFEWVKAVQATRLSGLLEIQKDYSDNLISLHVRGGMADFTMYLKKTDVFGNSIWERSITHDSPQNPFVSAFGIDTLNNIYLIIHSYEPIFRVGQDSIIDTTFFNPMNPIRYMIVKLASAGTLLKYNVIQQDNLFGFFDDVYTEFDIIPNGSICTKNGSIIDSSLTVIDTGLFDAGNFVFYNNNQIVLTYADSILRISPSSGNIVSSLYVADSIQTIEIDTNGDIYIGDSIGVKKFDSSNNLVWQVNIGNVYDLDISDQFVWASVADTSVAQVFITKMSKSNAAIIRTDSLKNSAGVLIQCIDDDNAYVGSNLFNDGGATIQQFYVIWPPLIRYGDSQIFPSNFLGKYSSNNSTASLNFDDSFTFPIDNQGWFTGSGFCQGSPPFPVGYTLYNGTFGAGAQVIAELSDSSGSFSNPVLIGLDFPSGNKDTIYCQIPTTTISGNNYRIRLRCTVPALTSPQTIGDLTFYSEAPIVSASGPTTFCNGDSVTLTAINTNPFNPLQWSTGDTTSSITVTADGNYFASVSSGMCTYASPSIIVNAEPNLIDIDSINGTAGIINGQQYGYSVTPDPNATNYQWVTTCGNVVNGQGTHTASIIWNTANPCNLTVIVSNAACTDTATITVYPLTGTQETATASPMAYLFPNPAKEILNVRFSTPNSTHLIELVDVQGRLMERREVISQSQVAMNTDALAAGTYFLKVKRNEETSTMMFVKQ